MTSKSMTHRAAHLSLLLLSFVPVAGLVSHLPLGSEVAQAANRVRLSIQPNQSRYLRGTPLQINAQVLGSDRRPLAGAPLLVQEIYYDSGRRRTVERTLTTTATNASGTFTLNYRVPTDPNKDKVTLVFVNPVADGDSASFVIPIGR